MRNIWTIAKREYDHYFTTPIAYVVAFAILVVIGIIFSINLLYYYQNAFQSPGQTPDLSPIAGTFAFMLVFSVPALTMRLVSDENRMGTMELLLTAPIRDAELIIGKWLGAFLFILTVIAITLVYPIILNSLISPGLDQRAMMSVYLGMILLSSAFLALGVGISALFENQIAAFFVTFAVFVFLWWLVGFPAQVIQTGSDVFTYLSMNSHYNEHLTQGVVYLGDIVYYLSLTVLGLFSGTAAVEMRRWR